MARHDHYRDTGFARGRITSEMSTTQSIRALREIGEHVVQAAKNALRIGAREIVADAKSRCPVKTGRLKESIKAESNRDGSVYWITANASVEEPKSPTGRFYYGAVVEFSPKINKPFMYPALDAHRQEIYNNIDAAISKAATRSF